MTAAEPSDDVKLVLWSLGMHPEDGTPEGIARHVSAEMTTARIGDALREAEAEGYARELAGEWSLTEAGQTIRSAQD
jgi:hypothetical protein